MVVFAFQQFIPTITSWRVLILVAALTQFCVAFFVEVKMFLYVSGEISKALHSEQCPLFRKSFWFPQIIVNKSFVKSTHVHLRGKFLGE